MENIDKDILIAVYENRLNKTTKELVYQQAQSATALKTIDELNSKINELERELGHKDDQISQLENENTQLKCELSFERSVPEEALPDNNKENK